MPTWKSRGLRGSALEDMINYTIEQYSTKKLALIQKIPTPIKPINIDQETRHITLAYFDQKSTVDYIGAVQGIPICFDAKECKTDVFPIHNIHEHQMNFMKEYEQQQGISFLIIYFSDADIYYYVPFKDVLFFWERAKNGGRKSFRREELDQSYRIRFTNQIYIHYLEMLSKDLESREETE